MKLVLKYIKWKITGNGAESNCADPKGLNVRETPFLWEQHRED